jgi:hypothetical protein
MPDRQSDSLSGMLPRVIEELEQVEREIAEMQAVIGERRELRTQLRKVAHLLDPERQPPGHGQRKRKSQAGKTLRASAEKVDQLYAYLEKNQPADLTFSGPQLRRNGFDLMSEAMLNAALHQLQDQGRIRLDSVGGPGSSTRKNYKLVG